MYQTLYRKYRPTYFDEVVGQKVIIKTLKNAVENNKINHAYLFTGPRGTGKTSVAKILAKTINCQNLNNLTPCNNCVSCTQINKKQFVDIIEIDAASNNGVDEIRELKSKANLVPSIGKYKVYIIDEVHMLTTGAFNALLKILEEPPEHIIFILATTEPHKIPATILSRCQRFDFKKIYEMDIYDRLKQIAELENIKIDDESILEISRLADGGLRDALSLFDQVIAYSKEKITIEDIHEINGTLTPMQLKNLIEYLNNNDIENLFNLLEYYDQQGKNFVKLSEEIIIFLKNCLLSCMIPTYAEENILNAELYQIQGLHKNKILDYFKVFNQAIYDMKISSFPKIILETALINVMNVDEKKLEKEDSKTNKVVENIVNETVKKPLEPITSQNVDHTQIKNDKIEELQKIRINNTLCQFSKKELLNWKEKIKKVELEITNPQYGKFVSLLMDGELKAASKENLLFVYENENMVSLFNDNLSYMDDLLELTYHTKVHAIAIDLDHWSGIKREYNSKTKTYHYIEEPEMTKENLKHEIKKTEIETLFKDVLEYEK